MVRADRESDPSAARDNAGILRGVSSTRAIAPRLRVLGLFLAAWLAAPVITDAQATPEPQAPRDAHHRPRIGLVLSGGGARGTAHIGVLKVLEQMHVPIDAIAGTSMGAVVGGLYASGLSARDIEKVMTSINWQDAFRDRPPREDLDLRRKEEDETFLVKYHFGVRDGHLVVPKGLIQGQKLTETLRRLTLPVARITDFDELPTPFRAVATDLENGDSVVMGSGDLTSAMRASLSAPGVFTPVEREGRLLVDGGVADNVPVDVARTMDVDVLIVVDVGSPLLSRQELTSAPVISNQVLSILIQRNAQAQLETLDPRDILIRPALGNASAFDFGSVARVIGVGEKAARESAAQLAALAVSERDMQQYAMHREALRVPAPRIDFVTVEPGSEGYAAAADAMFGDLVGKPLDPDAVARRVTSLYGRGALDTLDYRVIGAEGNYGLALDARPASEGRYYLRFGLALQDDFEGNSTYTAALRFVMTDITRNAAEWVTDLSVGSTSGISSELFTPLAPYSGWFVMPHISDLTRDLFWYQQQNLLAKYRLHTFDYGMDFGHQFGNWGEIRIGAQQEQGHYVLAIGDPTDPNLPVQNFSPYRLNEYFVRLTYDRLNDINFPRSGQQAVVQYSAYRNASGNVQTADQVTASYIGAYSFGRDTLSFSAAGGTTLQANVTDLNLQFPLGGFLNLSARRADSLLGPNYGIARALFYRQIGRGGPGYFDVPTYLGVSLEAGNVWQSRSAASFGNTERNASVWLGLDTLIGPVYIASGFDTHGNVLYYLFLGRPFYGPH